MIGRLFLYFAVQRSFEAYRRRRLAARDLLAFMYTDIVPKLRCQAAGDNNYGDARNRPLRSVFSEVDLQGGTMSLPKFAIGMIFVIVVVAIWSLVDSAPVGSIALRAVFCAVVLQLGYFLYILRRVALQSRKRREPELPESASPEEPRAAKENFPYERPLSR